ncbi:mRNA-decapping enzyme subunit 2 [Cryptotrichosporon argae]
MVSLAQLPLAPAHADEDVWTYPRPPALQRCSNHLKVVWFAADGTESTIAETREALRVLETSHPPTYYLPPGSVRVALAPSAKHTFCEWKGAASYFDLQLPGTTAPGAVVRDRVWAYAAPTGGFAPLKDYVSFYASGKSAAGEWACFVDGERVGVQEGDFYGGWVTRNIKGKMKGGPGTWGW